MALMTPIRPRMAYTSPIQVLQGNDTARNTTLHLPGEEYQLSGDITVTAGWFKQFAEAFDAAAKEEHDSCIRTVIVTNANKRTAGSRYTYGHSYLGVDNVMRGTEPREIRVRRSSDSTRPSRILIDAPFPGHPAHLLGISNAEITITGREFGMRGRPREMITIVDFAVLTSDGELTLM